MSPAADNQDRSTRAEVHQGPWTERVDHRARIKARAQRVELAFGLFAGAALIEGLLYAATTFIRSPGALTPSLIHLQGVMVWVVMVMAFVVAVQGARLQKAISAHAQDVAQQVRSQDHV